MKQLFFSVTFMVVFSSAAMADLEQDLDRCSIQCSNFCADVIDHAKQLTASAESNCGSSSNGRSEVVSSCSSAFPYDSSKALECSKYAKDGEAVSACSRAFAYDSSKALECSKHARNGETVSACSEAFAYDSSRALECSKHAQNGEAVSACSRAFPYDTSKALECCLSN
jgi:hypothetical protein